MKLLYSRGPTTYKWTFTLSGAKTNAPHLLFSTQISHAFPSTFSHWMTLVNSLRHSGRNKSSERSLLISRYKIYHLSLALPSPPRSSQQKEGPYSACGYWLLYALNTSLPASRHCLPPHHLLDNFYQDTKSFSIAVIK